MYFTDNILYFIEIAKQNINSCDRVHVVVKSDWETMEARLIRKQEKRKLKNLEIDEELAEMQRKAELKKAAKKELQVREGDVSIFRHYAAASPLRVPFTLYRH